MKPFKISKGAAEVTVDVAIIDESAGDDAFVVVARHMSPDASERLGALTSKQVMNLATGQQITVRDDAKWMRHAPDFYIAGWSGLRPRHFAKLNIALEEDPEVDANGCVPYSQDAARQLWEYAAGDIFIAAILQASRRALEADQARREQEKKASAGACAG